MSYCKYIFKNSNKQPSWDKEMLYQVLALLKLNWYTSMLYSQDSKGKAGGLWVPGQARLQRDWDLVLKSHKNKS